MDARKPELELPLSHSLRLCRRLLLCRPSHLRSLVQSVGAFCIPELFYYSVKRTVSRRYEQKWRN